ncbi:unnamed protein product [Pleuronectes platessa]|uniref:Uncharacterized protein n=1 Tax=Pleuronectes platessa TaxID=8262 RepID=A0A9N7YM82_PLEPL|nr:unnamed protein product [Pleuronectes platessa]
MQGSGAARWDRGVTQSEVGPADKGPGPSALCAPPEQGVTAEYTWPGSFRPSRDNWGKASSSAATQTDKGNHAIFCSSSISLNLSSPCLFSSTLTSSLGLKRRDDESEEVLTRRHYVEERRKNPAHLLPTSHSSHAAGPSPSQCVPSGALHPGSATEPGCPGLMDTKQRCP